MGAFDNLDDIVDKAKYLATEHGDKVGDAVDKATDAVDKKTGRKFSDKLESVDDAARDYLDKEKRTQGTSRHRSTSRPAE